MPEINLTPRQKEIVKLTAQGFTVSEIARKLHIAENTIHTHTTRIYNSLRRVGVTNHEELIRYATEHGMV